MPKGFWFILIPLIIILIVVNGYLLFTYFLVNNSPIPSPTPFNTFNGEIKPGWQLPEGSVPCPKSLYIMSNNSYLEVASAALGLTNVDVTITGKIQKGGACGDSIEVSDLQVNSDQKDFTVEGNIVCLKGTDPDTLEGCSKVLDVQGLTFALLGDTVDVTPFEVNDRIQVEGSVDVTFSSTQNYYGGINVLKMEKI